MPVSEKQHAANRANAAKSTGPRTPAGKARSSQNARTHGFTASTFTVARLEDLQEVAHLKADLTALYQPVNSQEIFALDHMAIAQQTVLRAARLEAGLFTTCLDMALNDDETPITPMTPHLAGNGDLSLDIEITRAQNRNYALADGFHRMVRQANSWSLFLRYQAQAERHYRRAVEEFDASNRSEPNYQTNPFWRSNPKKKNPLAPRRTNPFHPLSGPPPPPPSRAPRNRASRSQDPLRRNFIGRVVSRRARMWPRRPAKGV